MGVDAQKIEHEGSKMDQMVTLHGKVAKDVWHDRTWGAKQMIQSRRNKSKIIGNPASFTGTTFWW